MIVVALMSGTSVDAIDVAAADLRFDAEADGGPAIRMRLLGHHEHPWPDSLRNRLLGLLPPAETSVAQVCEMDTLVGQAFAAAAVRGVAELADGRADLVVSHGQTMFHWVDGSRCRGTLQIGQPAWIAEATGLPVVSDLRASDVAAGGHGAPLASTLDALWLASEDGTRAGLNLGGIANVTVVGQASAPVIAWDIGPANCLIDLAAQRVSGGLLRCDVDGRLATAGRIRDDLLARLLAEPYYALPAPKSTGRELFHAGYLDTVIDGLPEVAGTDLLATLTELTAVTVAAATAPYDVVEVVVSGGGTRNPALVAALRRRLAGTLVISDDRGLPAEAKEAYLFALLGMLTWHGVPGVAAACSGPTPTGARTARILGRISPGTEPLVLPDPVTPPRLLRITSAS